MSEKIIIEPNLNLNLTSCHFCLTVSTNGQQQWYTVALFNFCQIYTKLNLQMVKIPALLPTKGLCFIQCLAFDSFHSLAWLMVRLYSRLKWPEDLGQRAWHFSKLLFPWFRHTGSDRDKGVQEKRGGILYHTLTHYRLPLLPHIQLGLFIWDIALYPRCSIDFCHFQTVGHDCSLVPFCFYKLTLMPL